MPWRKTCAMDERMRFVVAASEDEAVMTEVCAEFGISRQTGYKWLARYEADGVEGFAGLQPRADPPWAGARRGVGITVESRKGAVAVRRLANGSVSLPRSSNRTCGFPASGFPTGFIAKPAAAALDASV
jgi:transposase-like protein